jgi:hypothetical protein
MKIGEKIRMKKHDAAWLAAAIDGEGTIGIYRNAPKISIANNSREFLEKAFRICRRCGGISVRQRKTDRGRTVVRARDVKGMSGVLLTYSFTVARIDVVENVLREILPFLIIKKENARRVLKWLRSGREIDVRLTHSNKRWGRLNKKKLGKRYGEGSGNWGRSEEHRRASLLPSNRHKSGWFGDSKGHSAARIYGSKKQRQ